MMIHALVSDALPTPRFRYSPIIAAGPWVLFSGMIALDPTTGELQGGGPGRETAKILANLSAAMPGLALDLDALASVKIFTTRFEEFAAINDAWESWLGPAVRPPARTSVGVVALPLGATVEMEFAFYTEHVQ
jgi:2-iminobutanoate/2-iminopropanoate deaminase